MEPLLLGRYEIDTNWGCAYISFTHGAKLIHQGLEFQRKHCKETQAVSSTHSRVTKPGSAFCVAFSAWPWQAPTYSSKCIWDVEDGRLNFEGRRHKVEGSKILVVLQWVDEYNTGTKYSVLLVTMFLVLIKDKARGLRSLELWKAGSGSGSSSHFTADGKFSSHFKTSFYSILSAFACSIWRIDVWTLISSEWSD